MSEVMEAPPVDTGPAPDPLAEVYDRHAGIGHNGGPDMPQDAPARAPDGKFAKSEVTDATAEPEAPVAAPEAVSPAADAPALPNVPADLALDVSRLPAAARDAFLRDVQEGRIHLGAPPAPPADPVASVVRNYEQTIKGYGHETADYVDKVLVASFRMNADPINMLATLAENYGVAPQLAQILGGQAVPQQGLPPEVAQLRAELQELRQWRAMTDAEREQSRQASEAAQLEAAQRELGDFAKGREHFEIVRKQMAAFVQSGLSLDDAYKAACAVNPIVAARAKQADEVKQRADAAARSAQARRGASYNIPATTGGVAVSRPSIEQSAGDVYDRYAGLS